MNFCLWITGLPGSGKSTIVAALEGLLTDQRIPFVTLALDDLRTFLTPEPAYTDTERDIVYRSLVMTARLLMIHSEKSVIIDATGNRRKFRELAREGIVDFAEVYVACPLHVCMEREGQRTEAPVQRNLYGKALEGSLEGELPGVSVPYEAPKNPDLTVHSDGISPAESARKIMDYVQSRWLNRGDGKGRDFK